MVYLPRLPVFVSLLARVILSSVWFHNVYIVVMRSFIEVLIIVHKSFLSRNICIYYCGSQKETLPNAPGSQGIFVLHIIFCGNIVRFQYGIGELYSVIGPVPIIIFLYRTMVYFCSLSLVISTGSDFPERISCFLNRKRCWWKSVRLLILLVFTSLTQLSFSLLTQYVKCLLATQICDVCFVKNFSFHLNAQLNNCFL